MRELTFKGFITQYVKELSLQHTLKLSRLIGEIKEGNLRLREPLLLYVLATDKRSMFRNILVNTDTLGLYDERLLKLKYSDCMEMIKTGSPLFNNGYKKVWQAYETCRNKPVTDNKTKELMRKKIIDMQRKKHISNYRIYSDLKLNPGNINDWLKNGDGNRVSLETARSILAFVQ